MGGSSSFWPGSSICLYSRLQFLPRPKRNDPTGGDGDLFSGLWVTSGPLTLLAQIEIAETRQLHLLVALERGADFLEEELDDFLRFALVEPEFLEQTIGDLCLRQRAHVLESPRMSGCPRRRSPLGRSRSTQTCSELPFQSADSGVYQTIDIRVRKGARSVLEGQAYGDAFLM